MVLAHRLQLVIGLCGGFLFGCVVAEHIPHIQFTSLLLAGCTAAFILVWPKPLARTVVISTIGIVIGVLVWQHAYRQWNTGLPTGEVVQIHGWVAALITPRENNDRTIIEVIDARQGELLVRSAGTVRLAAYVPKGLNLQYGTEVTFTTKLEKLPTFGDFDGRRYWRLKHVQAQVHPKQISPGSGIYGNSTIRELYHFRAYLSERIHTSIPSPEADLLLGILYGDQGGLSQTIQDQFRAIGISHLTAVSGYNLTIIALWPLIFAGLIPRRFTFMFSALFVGLFMIFAGGASSIVRAGIMAWVALIGKDIGRAPHTLLLIILTATGMAIINPFVVRDDAGFILSFLAFFGLVEIGPLITKYIPIPWVPVKSTASETLGAQLMTLPYLLGAFGQLSLGALPVNILILPLIPVIMFVGLGGLLLVTIHFILFEKLVGLLYFPLHWFLLLVQYLASIPYISVAWPKGGYFPWFLSTIVILWWLYKKYQPNKIIESSKTVPQPLAKQSQ